MDTPLSGSDGLQNRISNLDQAAACTGNLFLISEDRLKILASLAKQVFQMCEEFYKVESKPSESTAHVHWPPTEDAMENVPVRDVKTYAAVSDSVSQEEIFLPTSHLERRHGETTENRPKTRIGSHNGEGDIFFDPGGSGDMNVVQTQPEMTESTSAMKAEDDLSHEDSEWQMLQIDREHDANRGNDTAFTHTSHSQPAMMESTSVMKVDNSTSSESTEWQIHCVKTEHDSDIVDDTAFTHTTHSQPAMMESTSVMKVDNSTSSESTEWQIHCVKTEHDSDIDPVNDIGANNVEYTQPEMMESPNAVKDEDIAANVRTEQNTDAGYYVRSHVTPTESMPLDRENVPTSSGFAGTTNDGRKPYKCPACGKPCTSQSTLRRHWRTHTGEKPYICPDCGKTFSRQYHCNRHRRLHSGVKPFQCPYCGKTFTRKSHVHAHMRVHSGERPFKCQQCGREFTVKSSLVNHLERYCREKPC